MEAASVESPPLSFKRYRFPRTVIARFMYKRTVKSAVFWAVVFGVTVASKAIGYSKAYPTLAGRLKLSEVFGNNIGLAALLGKANHIETVAGYTVWNTLGTMVIIGGIWGLLIATKSLRGSEDSGRWELLLSGQTTARRAAGNAIAGLSLSLLTLYFVAALCFIGIGKNAAVNYGPGPALFFALAAISSAAVFLAVATVTSQLMPTRSRASIVATTIFGIAFLLRAMADITTYHWLSYLTPLGWIEKLQPLYAPQAIWLLPIFGLVVILFGVSIYLAGKRDLGDATFADKDTSKPRTRLLSGVFTSSLRLTRTFNISWLLAITWVALFFGFLTNAAVQAFNQSAAAQHAFHKIITHSSGNAGAKTYLGFIFLMLMMTIMAYVASAMGRLREEEADGELDNVLVRPVSRTRWLSIRLGLITLTIILAGVLTCLATWLGEANQRGGVSFHDIMVASVNILAPAVFTLGVGVLAFGFIPRLTTVLAYGVLGWSFLIEIISSGINLNHWITDTSILSHIALSPAVSPDWSADWVIFMVGLALCIIGAARFNDRDLVSE